MATFEAAIPVILAHEGGFVDDPDDPGGATNYGISTRFLRARGSSLDARTMTREQAVTIYRDWIWRKSWEGLPTQALATKVFDIATNAGESRSVKSIQSALVRMGASIDIDGVLGPATWAALKRADAKELLFRVCAEQARHHVACVDGGMNPKFIPGWLRRDSWAG